MSLSARTRLGRRHRHVILLASFAATASLTHAALGQTSSTWAVDVGSAGGSWSNPINWAGGVVPDGGGTALFNTLPSFTTAPVGIIQDLPTVSLSGMTFDTFITYIVRPPTGNTTNSITLTGPATINVAVPSIGVLGGTSFLGDQAQLVLAGNSGLMKSGPGTFTLTATNTYTGGTTVNGGILVVRSGDLGLGNTSGGVTLNDGTLRTLSATLTTARQINLAGNGTLDTFTGANVTFNGAVVGAGDLNKVGSAGVALTAAGGYTGATNLLAGTMTVGGNGALTATSRVVLRNTLTLDDTLTNLPDRINDAAPVTFYGSGLTLNGIGTTGISSSETIGDAKFSRGMTTITLAPNGAVATLNAGAVIRDTGGVVFFRGDNLGTTPPAPSVAKITFTTPPALVGGGGADGSTNVSIIPWAYGSNSAGSTINFGGNSFVTYGANGVRPLSTSTEYETTLPVGSVTTSNVRLTAAPPLVSSPTRINSLILAVSGAPVIGGSGTLTISSGAVLALNTTTVNCPVDFGSAEGVIVAQAPLTFSTPISGSGGLSKQGVQPLTLGSGASTYTGTTIIGGGTLTWAAGLNITKGGASPLGDSTSAVVLAPAGAGVGGATARLVSAGTSTFDRDLLVTGRVQLSNNAILPAFGVGAGPLTMNGNIILDGSPLTFVGPGAAAGGTITVNGNISGNGAITDASAGVGTSIQLFGNNTFTDGVELNTAAWQLGSDHAFGPGMIKMVGISGGPVISAIGVSRVVPNDAVAFGLSATYWTIAGNNDITFTGSLSLASNGALLTNHIINNTGTTTYAGVLHTGGFIKSGPGLLVLSGSNIYTGQTQVNNGILRITNDYGLGVANTPSFPTAGPDTFVLGTIPTGAGTNLTVTPGVLEIANNINTPERIIVRGNLTNTATQTVNASTNFVPTGNLRSIAGNNTISGPVYLNANVGVGVDAGSTLTFANALLDDTANNTGALHKVGGGKLTIQNLRLGGANEVKSGILAIAGGRGAARTSNVGSLSISPGAAMDLGDNDLVYDYAGASPIGTIAGYIAIGYGSGSWTGGGLTSSTAAAQAGSGHRTALGYAESSAALGASGGTFSGQSVDSSAVLVRYTYTGDADVNGTVDLTDFTYLAANFNTIGGATWINGDFNYDGNVDLSDFTLLASNFNSTLPAGDARPGGIGAVVPEPASLAFAALTTAGIASSRFRRRRTRGTR